MRALTAFVLALVFATAAAPATAYTYRERRALDVATAKWKRLPCAGLVTIAWVDATEITGLEADALLPCTIHLSTFARPNAIWPVYCTVIVHEVGHLLGYGHSADPRSVMYPSPRNYWRCNHSTEWSLKHRAT